MFLLGEGYEENVHYIIQKVPNIVNITYGRDVGYKIEQESFDKETESISATEIRDKLDSQSKSIATIFMENTCNSHYRINRLCPYRFS